MAEVPFHLGYTLSRSQRFVPILRYWGAWYVVLVVVLLAFFCVQTLASLYLRSLQGVVVFGGLAVGAYLFLRGLYLGVLDVALARVRQFDLVVEESAIGILLGGERWYLFLDGITAIRQYRDDLWTIEHHSGTVLHIPTAAITEEQLQHLRTAMERGRTPEGFQAVIERGKRIREIRESLQDS